MLLVIKASGQYNPQDAQFAGEWPQIGNHHLAQSVKKNNSVLLMYLYNFIYLYIYTIFIHTCLLLCSMYLHIKSILSIKTYPSCTSMMFIKETFDVIVISL